MTKMKLALGLISLLFSVQSFAVTTDYACVDNCTNSGMMYGLCKKRCSYEEEELKKVKSTDYSCVSKCYQQGSLYSFCKAQCSY